MPNIKEGGEMEAMELSSEEKQAKIRVAAFNNQKQQELKAAQQQQNQGDTSPWLQV